MSLRSTLLIGILLPVLMLVAINTVSLYRQALHAADTAYDRTLLASAKSIGEQLAVVGEGDAAQLMATVPYSALETFEADNRSQMFYKVSGFAGELVSGFDELPAWRGKLPVKGPYAALVDFYDDVFRGQPVRVAQINLNGDLKPAGEFDVIFLRNVMIYFDMDMKRRVAEALHRQLRPGGWLFIGHSESLNGVTERFRPVRPTIYRKERP